MGVELKTDGFEVADEDGVCVVKFLDEKILDETRIWNLGLDLMTIANDPTYCRFIFDLERVSFMSSAMIGKWILISKKLGARALGDHWAICNIEASVLEVFKITRMNRFVPIVSDMEAAMRRVN